jgi:hypothetical protein
MHAPDPRQLRRSQADFPLIGLSEFGRPPLRAEFITGRSAIEAFLTHKWAREIDYRPVKEVWTHRNVRIAARFSYEYHDDSGTWLRAFGNENWQFDPEGFLQRRIASINEHPIPEASRLFHWPLGRRPEDHPGLTDLGS